MGATAIELALNKKLTKWFIETDPTTLVLVPLVKVDRPGGAKKMENGTPRAAQDFKIIYPGGDGIVVTSDGTTRRFDFIILGEYDANLAIGDHWTESNQHYSVEYLFPFNGYEVKGGGVSHGSAPDHG